MVRKKRSGFTLVELLVVISIIGMLMALLLPAVQNARETGRRAVCLNNVGNNLGKALYNLESQKGSYPGYLNYLAMNNGMPYKDQMTGQARGVSWVVPLLPYLERGDLLRIWKTPAGSSPQGSSSGSGGSSSGGSSTGILNPKVYLEILVCPSDPPPGAGGTPISYVCNSGMQDNPPSTNTAQSGGGGGSSGGGSSGGGGGGGGGGGSGGSGSGGSVNPSTLQPGRDDRANGVFFDGYSDNPSGGQSTTRIVPKMSSAYISAGDGMSTTLLLSENVDANNYDDMAEQLLGFIWNPSTVNTASSPPTATPPSPQMMINNSTGMQDVSSGQQPQYMFCRPSSNHPGGVNMTYCDGHARFVSQDISYYVYCLLMSPNGNQVKTPGTKTVLPNYNRPLDESWVF
jgi:prepilin-type N-terminal cleavage/methylation domain-containing protein/prepilin-type processing-associated H-X9-DG protein